MLCKVAEVLGMSLSEMVIAPNPSGEESVVQVFWQFLRSDDTLFSMEKYKLPDGEESVSMTLGNHPYPRKDRDD